jgi:hypothetical protein
MIDCQNRKRSKQDGVRKRAQRGGDDAIVRRGDRKQPLNDYSKVLYTSGTMVCSTGADRHPHDHDLHAFFAHQIVVAPHGTD